MLPGKFCYRKITQKRERKPGKTQTEKQRDTAVRQFQIIKPIALETLT